MKKWILGFVIAALPCVAVAAGKANDAQAQAIAAKFDQLFNEVDSNSDGKISREEAELKAPAMAENFARIDANQDAGLSKQEIKDFTAQMKKARLNFNQHFAKADKDKNNMLSKTEAKAMPLLSENFDAMDANHDNQLVIKEIADFLRARQQPAAPVAPAAPVSPTTP